MQKFIVLLASSVVLSGCASIVSGTTQNITITSTPPGAACDVIREGRVINTIAQTPNTITVEKTKHDLVVECTMAGYDKGIFHVDSGNEGSTLGNIILGGGIGWAVDSARGADNKYAEFVNVPLAKQ